MVLLNIQTGYSFLSSSLLSGDLIGYHRESPQHTYGIANVNVIFDALEVHHRLNAEHVDLVLGMTFRHLTEEGNEGDFNLIARSDRGVQCIKELTESISGGRQKARPKLTQLPIDDHLLYIYPSLYGYISSTFSMDNRDAIRGQLHHLNTTYPNFYLGINFPSNDDHHRWNTLFRELAQDLGITTLAFPRIRTMTVNDNHILDVLTAIQQGCKVSELSSLHTANESIRDLDYRYFTHEEWKVTDVIGQLYPWHPIRQQKLPMPFQVPLADIENDTYLRALASKGLQRRLKTPNPPSTYVERLTHELDIIIKLGYADYFLVVYDYVKFAKNQGILVGPGRGSGAASLVCYTLGITDVDPLQYGLLFERFLNPERISMPDIDVDFQDDRRQEVINYLRERYTNRHFAHVVAFTRFQAKSALRDVGKALGIPLTEVDRIAKSVTATGTLSETYESNVGFRAIIDSTPLYRDVYETAQRIELLPRQTTLHAAGVVISKLPLSSCTPVYEHEPQVYSTQYDMTYIEEEGLLKMDILGLKNLTIIQTTLASINATRSTPLTLQDLSLNDERVYELIRSGRTSGIFQLESGGIINEAIKVVLPENFEDIVSILALFRPGPKDYIPVYAARKHGKETYQIFPRELTPILAPTMGIIVYQEQIMQIVQVMAGFSVGKADIIRRAISKKKESEMLRIKQEFFDGARHRGHTEAVIQDVFDMILKFADYGFARAHAVAYAVVSVQMAYLKCYYPTHFYAAVLNSFALGANDSKLNDYITEIRRLGLKVKRPSIQTSARSFLVNDDQTIEFALLAINGIGSAFVEALIQERQRAPFVDYMDLIARLPLKLRQEKAITALIDAGALDDFQLNRATLRANLATAMTFAQIVAQTGGQTQHTLTPVDRPRLKHIQPNPIDDLEREYKVLGMFLSGFPLAIRRQELYQQGYVMLQDLGQMIGQYVKIIVYVNELKVIRTKKGEAMALAVVVDELDQLTLPIFPKVYSQFTMQLKRGSFVTMEGRVETRDQGFSLHPQLIRIESRI